MDGKTPYLVTVPGREAYHIRDGSKRITTKETNLSRATDVLMKYISEKKSKSEKPKESFTVDDIIAIWRVYIKKKNEKIYDKKWRYIASTLERYAGHIPVSKINTEWSERYIESRYDDGVQRATVRQELQVVKKAWSLAKLGDPPEFELPDASDPKADFLTKEEASRLIAACSTPHLRTFVRLGLATGSRPGALLDLEWNKVNLERGFIDLTPQKLEDKSKKKPAARHVPVNEDIVAMLKEARAVAQTNYVIEFKGSKVESIKKAFATAVKKAEIKRRITPHILRHTAASWMMQASVDPWLVAGVLGHKDIKMVLEVYGHHDPNFLGAAKRALSM